jgi:hypothetical protein
MLVWAHSISRMTTTELLRAGQAFVPPLFAGAVVGLGIGVMVWGVMSMWDHGMGSAVNPVEAGRSRPDGSGSRG